MYMYFITYLLILITSPATTLNSPINSFCSLDTALALTSDIFFSIFPLPSSSFLPVPSVTWCYVYIHLFSSDKYLSGSQNVSIKFPCALLVYLCLLSGFFYLASEVPEVGSQQPIRTHAGQLSMRYQDDIAAVMSQTLKAALTLSLIMTLLYQNDINNDRVSSTKLE